MLSFCMTINTVPPLGKTLLITNHGLSDMLHVAPYHFFSCFNKEQLLEASIQHIRSVGGEGVMCVHACV